MGAMLGAAMGGALTDGFIQGYTKRKEYQKQKDFIVMRYRWAVRDMKKAGLNPILAAGQSQPIGSAPDMGVNTDFQGAISSAMQMRLQKKAIDSQVLKNTADAASASADATRKTKENEIMFGTGGGKAMDVAFVRRPGELVPTEEGRRAAMDYTYGRASAELGKLDRSSYYEQGLRADIERSRSSAVSNIARARYDDAMAALGPVRADEIRNAIKNRNLDDLKKAWMSLGGQAISTFAEFLAAYGIKKTPGPSAPPRPRTGF